jgi:ABC-type phosphate transport system substrate-binding protein
MRTARPRRSLAGCLGLLALTSSLTIVAASAPAPSPAGADPALATIQGSGSSWAANAVNQWVSAVASQGVQVVFNPDGDAAGRQDFANKTSDFAVTSEGFQGGSDTSQNRPYAYLPIAAGGTSFPYQIRVDGQQVENLRLSGETLVKIFTNQITNWDDPAITADNNGVALPSLPIIPVVQSEGSGSTYQLTSYFAAQFPSIWTPFAGAPGPTEYFPRQGTQIAQNGSNSAMNYVASSEANGSIGYVEYSYPLSVNYPVAKVLNSAGYFTLPTQYNVAVALEDAQINMDPSSPNYLLQNLSNVYTDPDPRTYPLSSYVYMVEPTGAYPSPETRVNNSLRQTLADFAYYDICQGQSGIGALGYSSLPVNLVEAAFGQIQQLQTADPSLDLSNLNIQTCNNPTFDQGQPNTNYLTVIAPQPPSCDKQGAGPCAAGVTPNGIGATPDSSGTYPGASGTKAGAAGAAAESGAAGTGAEGSTGSTGPGATASTASQASGPTGSAASALPTIHGTTLPDHVAESVIDRLAPYAVVPLLLVFALPVVIAYRRRRAKPAPAVQGGTEP